MELKKLFFLYILLVAAGFVFGYLVAKPSQIVSSPHVLRENTEKYKFIHPLLAVNRANDNQFPQYASLAKKVENIINSRKKLSLVDNASVYFISYDIDNNSFSVNGDEKYAPASLIKVVIMMSYLKQSESEHNFLNKTFEYIRDITSILDSIPFEAQSKLKVGTKYSVFDLINKMIVDSDNGAKDLLLLNIDKDYFYQVYTNLGFDTPEKNPKYEISPKDYSLFLRVLYNSTYLNDENSEKALSFLSQTSFADGLVAGLPKGTMVAHKFGEYADGSDYKMNSIELHDCGIIYAPQNPYLLCVMTRGKELKNLENTIAAISKLVYEQVK